VPAPVVVPVALYRPGDAMHRALRRYKDAPSVTARRHHRASLALILDRFLSEHGACVGRAGGGWDAVATVPSNRGIGGIGGRPRPGLRVPHPFDAVVDATRAFATTPRQQLLAGTAPIGHLHPAPDAYEVVGHLAGRRVLVLDDTWTTGAHARCAAAALIRAGAQGAGLLVVGRVVDPAVAPGVERWWGRVTRADPDRQRKGGAAGWYPGERCCLEPCRVDRSPTGGGGHHDSL